MREMWSCMVTVPSTLSTVSPQEKRLCWSKILRKAKRQPFCRVLAFQRTLRLCNTRLH